MKYQNFVKLWTTEFRNHHDVQLELYCKFKSAKVITHTVCVCVCIYIYRFITVKNKTTCSPPKKSWVQDYIQILNATKETRQRWICHHKHPTTAAGPKKIYWKHSDISARWVIQVEKQKKSLVTSVPLSSVINDDTYKNTNKYFCLK